MRRLHYSIHTETAYYEWAATYVNFHKMQVREAVEPEKKVEEYLTFNALVFLYKRALEQPLVGIEAKNTEYTGCFNARRN